jgi:hypothetical protein
MKNFLKDDLTIVIPVREGCTRIKNKTQID